MIELKNFQQSAIDELSNQFLKLWKTGGYKLPLVFKSPTGSGKTIMMAEFLRCLDDNYQFDEDKAYIWVSFGGDDSWSQSKKKLYKYYNEGTDMNLKDQNNLNEGKLYKNNIFFINWSKIKGTDKESKKLRKPNEHTDGEFGIFDEYIQRTKKERDLVLIIDEAHTETNTKLAEEIIELINPRIILKVTATPKSLPSISDVRQGKAGFVEVLEEDVIQSGLIKEKLIIQTEEEIQKLQFSGLTEDEKMLELAYNKRLELKKHYQDLGLEINPLVLIQLPNDEKKKDEVVINKEELVKTFLSKKGVQSSEIAIWLSDKKENKELIEKNESEVSFLIFKLAAGTGWDCPRADVLVMFREINSPSFHTQILGRVKRIPNGQHYSIPELNNAYIYTNYNKNHIQEAKIPEGQNKPPIDSAFRKTEIDPIKLVSVFYKRADYNSIEPEHIFQRQFKEFLDTYFGTKPIPEATLFDSETHQNIDFTANRQAIKDKIDLEAVQVKSQIVTDAEISSFDNFIDELQEKAKDTESALSYLDVERLYNLLCFKELANQEVEEAKFAPARSWSPLKKALNVWFSERFGMDRKDYYAVIVNQLINPASELKKAIHKALIEFRQTYNIEIQEKEEKENREVEIPPLEISVTADYELIGLEQNDIFGGQQTETIKKNVYNKFYLKKDYKGRANEFEFIQFLETQEIDWWHKQEDSGKDYFAVEYFDTQEQKQRLFYPDFIVKKDNKLYLLDTKKGETAKSQNTKDKAEALQKWIKENQEKYNLQLIGGIVDKQYPSWKINSKEAYIYEQSEDWEEIKF